MRAALFATGCLLIAIHPAMPSPGAADNATLIGLFLCGAAVAASLRRAR